MDSSVEGRSRVVNCVGAPWYEDLSPALLNECLESGVAIVGCTAQEVWDDTLETIENLQQVKNVASRHGRAYVLLSASDLDDPENLNKVGVVLGFQNPKPASDSLHFLEAFIDMGLRCCSLAFRENSYYGCGFASPIDTGLTTLGRKAVEILDERGVLIDLSHSGDKTAFEALELSKHPVIFSHPTARQFLIEHGARIGRATEGTLKRATPDELIKAAAEKGGVICPDARLATVADFVDQIDYLVQLVGPDHVGVSAQDDWHRSEKDARRVQPYLPGYDSVAGAKKREYGTDYQIYRVEGRLGPQLLHADALREEFARRNYPDQAVSNVLGGNLIRVFREVLPEHSRSALFTS